MTTGNVLTATAVGTPTGILTEEQAEALQERQELYERLGQRLQRLNGAIERYSRRHDEVEREIRRKTVLGEKMDKWAERIARRRWNRFRKVARMERRHGNADMSAELLERGKLVERIRIAETIRDRLFHDYQLLQRYEEPDGGEEPFLHPAQAFDWSARYIALVPLLLLAVFFAGRLVVGMAYGDWLQAIGAVLALLVDGAVAMVVVGFREDEQFE